MSLAIPRLRTQLSGIRQCGQGHFSRLQILAIRILSIASYKWGAMMRQAVSLFGVVCQVCKKPQIELMVDAISTEDGVMLASLVILFAVAVTKVKCIYCYKILL
jgi:hypothetical protein